jgi:hypothetical protein
MFENMGAQMVRELHTDRRNCQRAIDRLVEAGWLKRKTSKNRGYSNRYWLAGAGPSAAPWRSQRRTLAVPAPP